MSTKDAVHELNIVGYDPQARIIGHVLPRRAATLFSCEPAIACYKLPFRPFDLPINGQIGKGWRSPEDDGTGGTFRWMIQPRATVDLNLVAGHDLSLDFKVLQWIDISVIDSLKLTLNGHDIPLVFETANNGSRIYHATLPNSILESYPVQTQLVFTVDKLSLVLPNHSLGFALNWLRIRPA
jgi:hypothetical protein